MNSPDLRINARLTDEDARRFRELQQREGLSASELLRNALREYHAARVRPRANAEALLAAAGFIGADDGPVDLSSRYKHYLGEALDNKLASRVQDGETR
ncbi:MAG: ribbon-helix-helix protein, CopG family [Dokdonella sp.]